MSTGRTYEFRNHAERIALTSGPSRRQVADDLGGGLSTLNKWVNAHRDTDVVSGEDRNLVRETNGFGARSAFPVTRGTSPKKTPGILLLTVSQHPTWHIAMPEAGAIHSISGRNALTPIHQRIL